ncbi:MAG: glycoside hydrolase family 5 protein [Spirochaetales bacterium]|nr:glycoside hydrolase family 5 protein [Spirochaetales bacterium]MDY5915362.1 glycoside hydrolase family 5 protein [Treponema sp.]
MKITVKFLLILSLFASFLVTGCEQPNSNNKNDIPNKTDQEEKPAQNDESEPKDEKKIPIKFSYLWNENLNSYDSKTHTLQITKQWDRAVFDLANVQTKGKYFIIEYENLSGNLLVEVSYTDDSKNEVSGYSKKTRDYIILDQAKKLKEIAFISSLDEPMSVTIKKFRFADEFILEKEPIIDNKTAGTFNNAISAIDFVKEMGFGFNTGNFLEARTTGIVHGVSFYDNVDVKKTWGISEFTAQKFQKLSEVGGKSVRIPVSWSNHIIDENYTIDPFWMEEVKRIVDIAYRQGYYIVLNDHSMRGNLSTPLAYHEGFITRNTPEDIAESERYIKAVWKQITAAFNNSYDEHLIFETLNEPRNEESGTEHAAKCHTWIAGYGDSENCPECIADNKILNEYNQIIVDTIRESGGNNAKRFILIPGVGTARETVRNKYFKLPDDTAQDKLIVTIHHYPLLKNLMNDWIKNDIKQTYAELNEKFVKNGIPVVIGEVGHAPDNEILTSGIGHTATQEEQLAPVLVLAEEAGKYGMCPMLFYAEQTWENTDFAKIVLAAWEKGKQETENQLAKNIEIKDLWLLGENVSFDDTTKILKISGQYERGAIDVQTCEKMGKYIVFEYSNLSGNMGFDVVYDDDTRDTESCSSDKTKIYIKLNDTKKPVRFDFVSMDESEVSIKLCKLYYADEV